MESKSLFNDVVMQEDGIYKVEEIKNEIQLKRVANYICVTEQLENIDTDKIKVTVEFEPVGTKRTKKREMSVDAISNSAKVCELAEYGADVNSSNKNYVVKSLRNSREDAEYKYVHETLGFGLADGKIFFKHHETYNRNNKSQYVGDLDIRSKGTYDIWSKMMQDHVLGNTSLEIATILGLSASLVGYIASDISLESQFIHIFGDSSKGKTTAAQLAVSAFGNPNLKANGLVQSWNTTNNALQGNLAGNTGVPIVIDEASMSANQDFTKLIYTLGEGKEKARMNADRGLDKLRTWNTTIISTGEFSLLEKAKQNTGLRVRVTEFENVAWTTNAENADYIKEIIGKNYGHAGIKFVCYLLKVDKDKLIKKHQELRNDITKQLNLGEISSRVAAKLALFVLTAMVAKKALNLQFDIVTIQKFLISQENNKTETIDLGIRALQYLMQSIGVQKERFNKDYNKKINQIIPSKGECWGQIEYNTEKSGAPIRILINTKVVEDILGKDNKFESVRSIVSNWKSRGWLDYEEGKTYRKRNITGTLVQYYVLEMQEISKELGSVFFTDDSMSTVDCQQINKNIERSLPATASM